MYVSVLFYFCVLFLYFEVLRVCFIIIFICACGAQGEGQSAAVFIHSSLNRIMIRFHALSRQCPSTDCNVRRSPCCCCLQSPPCFCVCVSFLLMVA